MSLVVHNRPNWCSQKNKFLPKNIFPLKENISYTYPKIFISWFITQNIFSVKEKNVHAYRKMISFSNEKILILTQKNLFFNRKFFSHFPDNKSLKRRKQFVMLTLKNRKYFSVKLLLYWSEKTFSKQKRFYACLKKHFFRIKIFLAFMQKNYLL